MSNPLSDAELDKIKQYFRDLDLSINGTEIERRWLHATGYVWTLIDEIGRLRDIARIKEKDGEVAAEREACAQIAESDEFIRWYYDDHEDNSDIAKAIRARGKNGSE